MPTKDNTFSLKFEKFYAGQSPTAHLDNLTEIGGAGHYSAAQAVDIIGKPGGLIQGPGLSDLTAGTQAGAVSELINFIADTPAADNAAYGIGPTKLFKVSATAVTNDATFPHAITGATDGESTIYFQGAVYYFFNKASGGDCGKYDLASTFDDDYFSTVPTGAAALQNAPHPVAKKEDIMLFGNGRYVGTFISSTTTLAPTKLDFGTNTEVADVAFHANLWWIVINEGIASGTNRVRGSVFLYDGAALGSLLSDEVAAGIQKIGFIFPDNGTMFICYKDLSGTNVIGYILGRAIKKLAYFTGELPTFAQKTLYKEIILTASDGLLYAAGAPTPELPFALSSHANGGHATVGAVAAPFGTPLIASSDGGSNHRLAKFSGYDTDSAWRSIVIPLMSGRFVGMIDDIIVRTNTLGAGASCALKIEGNQAVGGTLHTSAGLSITGTGKRRHIFTSKEMSLGKLEDMRLFFDFSGGSATNPVEIKQVFVEGHYVAK